MIAGPDAYPEFVASHDAIGSNYIGSRRLFVGPTLRFFEFPKPMMGMRQHLQMSADVMSVMEQTSDAQAARRRLFEQGQKPRDVT